MPAALIRKRNLPLAVFFKIGLCLFLGMALLKVQTKSQVKSYDSVSWHENGYVERKLPQVEKSYKVSFVFDILSRTSSEISSYLNKVIDHLFSTTNSQLEAPNFFYKAIMFAGSAQIDDADLKEKISFYTNECLDKALPLIEKNEKNVLSFLYNPSPEVDQIFRSIKLDLYADEQITCLDLKQEVSSHMSTYAEQRVEPLEQHIGVHGRRMFNSEKIKNIYASQALANHYLDKRESIMGVHKGSQLPTTGGKIFQYLNRAVSWDGILSAFGLSKLHGAAQAAKRSQEFSEDLQRAPHIAGFIKLALIAVFPFLVFFIIAGNWKIIVYWFAVYTSVLLWAPIWSLLYHVMTSIAISSQTLDAFGNLGDGISMFSSQLITTRMYYFFSVYSWIQLLVGPLPTALLAWQLVPILRDTSGESTPDFVNEVVDKGPKVAGAIV